MSLRLSIVDGVADCSQTTESASGANEAGSMNTLSVDHLERLLNALKAHTGLNLDDVLFGAPSPILTRLLWRLRVSGIDSLLQAIEHHSPVFDELVDEIT